MIVLLESVDNVKLKHDVSGHHTITRNVYRPNRRDYSCAERRAGGMIPSRLLSLVRGGDLGRARYGLACV
jgi:hypothetical protein